MILAWSVFCFASALLFGGLQIYWAWRFVRLYPPTKPNDGNPLPHAAILLAVRGADPSLVQCLEGLLALDYPSFEIHLIVDSAEDPAWNVVRRILAHYPTAPLRVRLLEQRHDTCTLKVSALLQAVGELAPAVEVVALIDADVTPHRTWLRELVAPFADPRVGATSGIRWFAPGDQAWGTLVRAQWNAAAWTQMISFQIPWAGSMAFRAEVLRHADMRNQWTHSFCDDVSSYPILRRLGLELRFVPAATMLNRETIHLPNCFTFIRRQLLCSRLHHPRWPLIVETSVAAGLSIVLSSAMTIVAVAAGDWAAVACCGAALAVYLLGLAPCMVWIDHCVQRVMRARGEAPASTTWKTVAALPLTQAVYLAALVSVSFLRQVDWRGVTYRIQGPGQLRLLEYRPYQSNRQADHPSASLV